MKPSLLVPLDGTPLAETALPLAGRLAQALGATLELLRVVPAESHSDAESHAQRYLHDIASRQSAVVGTRVLRGNPAACIVREARSQRVTLVVMTTHARSGLRRAVLGSVAEYVVARSPVPTVLLGNSKMDTSQLRTLLLAIDESCAAALQTIVDLARSAAARVVLLRVVPFEETYVWQWHGGTILEEPQVVMSARQQLSDLASRLRTTGLEADVRVVVGSPVAMINRVADEVDADLIAVATHARTGTQRAVLGSVADAVVRTSGRPVLVCRLIAPPPGVTRPLDVVHALQRQKPPLLPQSIPTLKPTEVHQRTLAQ